MACCILNPFDNDIDLTTAKGHKLFMDGIKPLEEKYNGSMEEAAYFQTKEINASESRCWAMISRIIMDGKDVETYL